MTDTRYQMIARRRTTRTGSSPWPDTSRSEEDVKHTQYQISKSTNQQGTTHLPLPNRKSSIKFALLCGKYEPLSTNSILPRCDEAHIPASGGPPFNVSAVQRVQRCRFSVCLSFVFLTRHQHPFQRALRRSQRLARRPVTSLN